MYLVQMSRSKDVDENIQWCYFMWTGMILPWTEGAVLHVSSLDRKGLNKCNLWLKKCNLALFYKGFDSI